ncbi:MAG: galactitol-1-phosphate 5-dehydrogenase [Calditrichaeota bacterium]|nr:MAG: galactitol-1-phosphate 5-dehydrogenase [Calditrichota bacterium]
MKALVLEAYRKLVYQDVPLPELADDEVLVEVKACGICGSDVHGWDGSTGRRIPPLIMGHEASGVIAALGNLVRTWKIGDRVTFDSTIYKLDDWYTRKGMYNLSDHRQVLGVSPGEYRRPGAFTEYTAIPQHILYKMPDNISFNQAAMVEPFAVAFHAIDLTPFCLNDSVLVVGAGMIGLCLIQALRLRGCGRIWAVDADPDRLKLALQFGADQCFSADALDIAAVIKGQTHGRGADVAFEAVGIAASVKTALTAVRKGATITLVGNLSPSVELPLQAVVTQQLRLQGSCAIAGEFPAVLAKMACGVLQTDPLMTITAPLSEGAVWFERLYQKEKGLMKVILNP